MSLIARILTLIFYYTLAAGGHTVNTVEYLFNIQLPPFLLHNPLQLLVGVSSSSSNILFLFRCLCSYILRRHQAYLGLGHFVTRLYP